MTIQYCAVLLLRQPDVQEYYNTNQTKHRLKSNILTNQSTQFSVQSLLQRYREAYPTDPVSDHEFEKLTGELRPTAVSAERPATPSAGNVHNGSGSKALGERLRSTNHDQAEASEDERAQSTETHPDDVFAEFVSRWNSIRPGNGNAWEKGQPKNRPPQRKLDVLSWGFVE